MLFVGWNPKPDTRLKKHDKRSSGTGPKRPVGGTGMWSTGRKVDFDGAQWRIQDFSAARA